MIHEAVVLGDSYDRVRILPEVDSIREITNALTDPREITVHSCKVRLTSARHRIGGVLL